MITPTEDAPKSPQDYAYSSTVRIGIRQQDGRLVELPLTGPVTITYDPAELPPRRRAGKRRARAQQVRRRDRRSQKQ